MNLDKRLTGILKYDGDKAVFRNIDLEVNRISVSEKLLEIAYLNLLDQYDLTNADYNAAYKASDTIKLNLILALSFPKNDCLALLEAMSEQNRRVKDRKALEVLRKAVGEGLLKPEVRQGSPELMNQKDLLVLLYNQLQDTNARIEGIQDNQVKQNKFVRTTLQMIYKNTLSLIRYSAMRFADLYANKRAIDEMPNRPENSNVTLEYQRRLLIAANDELDRIKTIARTRQKG
ncbi:hypothetical protein JEM51_00140 [Ligilactobacillus agilis]|uniref:hypothetical protein n=1 Tax=Ligilactobacillus agilis TaxID=1601 RepID=UPI00191F21A8|nr:hypothetical protein [Ligilactobacillus agilis]MBL1054853.1 hypothetical protein [Ligilactobacillus agilis]